MNFRPTDRAGVTLVELLVVMGIIITIVGVSIPFLGSLRPNTVENSARDLFNVLRAAQVYATTNNVETAVAYNIDYVVDAREDVGVPVPIANAYAIVRQMTRKEYILHDVGGTGIVTTAGFDRDDNRPFILISSETQTFEFMEDGSCLLPDFFAYNQTHGISDTGLRGIRLWDLDERDVLEPRFDYNIDVDIVYADDYIEFPAHRFSPDGGMIVEEGPQRFTFQVGMMPSDEPSERFSYDPDEVNGDDDPDVIEAVFVDIFTDQLVEEFFPVLYYWPDPDDYTFDAQVADRIDIDAEIILHVPTGRVKGGS